MVIVRSYRTNNIASVSCPAEFLSPVRGKDRCRPLQEPLMDKSPPISELPGVEPKPRAVRAAMHPVGGAVQISNGFLTKNLYNYQAKPSQAKPSQAKPSQAKPSQAKPSPVLRP
jgi:hypothetical protein